MHVCGQWEEGRVPGGESMQTWGEDANSTQKGPSLETEPRILHKTKKRILILIKMMLNDG